MNLADRLSAVAPSATLALTQKAKEMRAAGRDVVSLTAGEPDFETPPHIIAAIEKAMKDGYTRYTAVTGLPELRQGICKYYADRGHSYGIDQVVVSSGAKQTIFNAGLAVLNPGDEALILAPYWLSYSDMVRLAEGVPVILQTKEADGFIVQPEALEQAITPKTRLFFMNSPSNPSGGVYNRAQMTAVAEVLRKHPDVWIISDEIYEHFTYGDAEFVSIVDVAPDLADRTLVINGCSKAYAMTGLRLGWGVGPKDLIKGIAKIQGQSTSNASAPMQMGALAAISGDQSCVQTMVKAFDERRAFVIERLQTLPGVTCLDPKGAFYAFPRIADLLAFKLPDGTTVGSVETLCQYLLEQYSLVTVPGTPFGAPEHLRLSYAADKDTLDRGLTRMAEAFARLS